ncbi:MAG TPA: ABC transporter permease subunit [Candidatus Limnocylindrales bacterium]|nr:ABC transporter permease subunit [Candidatus Limnocylindrales bacterium]
MTRADAGRFARNVALVAGLAGVLALAIVALFGAQMTPSDPQAQRLVLFFPDGVFKVPPTPPDPYYPLGTDPLGRDQLARILWGARLTFTVVLLALILRTALALGVGLLSGWRSGPIDDVLTLVSNAVAGVPQLLLALLIAILLREQAILGFVVALGLVGWAEGAQFVKAEVARIRRAAYVEAATAIGGRTSGILTRHVMRGLGPQLFGLVALEAGATLLLLAELGFLGVFMSGFVFQLDDRNQIILPVRDRAPEWGQMLAGAQAYAFSNQYVALVPGVVVAAAVFVFNLLGEGVRAATDPFSRLSLSPRAVGALGRGLAAFALVSAAFFGIAEARSTELSFEDAMQKARAAADRVEAGAPLLAGVARYSAESHGLAKAQRYSFYFRSKGVSATLRVGFPDADENAMEVKLDDEDGLSYQLMQPLGAIGITATQALQKAEDQGGRAYRAARTWLTRIVVSQDQALAYATYRVSYGTPQGIASPAVDLLFDARTGDGDAPEFRTATARLRAEALLAGPVAPSGVVASWTSSSAANVVTFGADKPARITLSFVRPDLPNDTRVASVTYGDVGGRNGAVVGNTTPRQQPMSVPVDIEAAFAAVERAGGAAARANLGRDWVANASTQTIDAKLQVIVSYLPANAGVIATFAYDVATGQVTRTR